MSYIICSTASTLTKMTHWGGEEPTDDIANYEKDDEGFSCEVSNYNEEDAGYVDFLGVEDILNSHNNDVDEFYEGEENYMFTRESVVDPFLSIFMACEREKERQKHGKGVYDRYQGIPMMRSVILILGCCLVLILRKSDWNELTGHPKDRGRDRPNSKTNSLKLGEDDVD
jgi:hypothetical protein